MFLPHLCIITKIKWLSPIAWSCGMHNTWAFYSMVKVTFLHESRQHLLNKAVCIWATSTTFVKLFWYTSNSLWLLQIPFRQVPCIYHGYQQHVYVRGYFNPNRGLLYCTAIWHDLVYNSMYSNSCKTISTTTTNIIVFFQLQIWFIIWAATWDFQQCGMCSAYVQSDQSIC